MADDGDYGGFASEGFRRSRKSRHCCECGREIVRGERYRYAHGKFEGDWWAASQCEHCAAAAKLLVRECRGFLYAAVMDDLEEHIHEVLPWSMQAARFVVAMRNKWKCIRKPGMMPVPVVDMQQRSAHA